MTDVNKRYRLSLDLQHFAEDDEESPNPTPDPEPETLKMTQAELDALITKRLGQERKKFADYDDLKAERDRLKAEEDERQKASLTEQERMAADLEAARKAAADADAAREAALKAANERVIKTEFRLAAAAANIRPDALEDAYVLADKGAIALADDGSITGLSEALAALVASKPYLVEAPAKPRQIGEPNNPKGDETKTLEAQLEEARKEKNVGKVIELSNKLAKLK